MKSEEVIKNIDEIQKFITEHVPVCDPNDDWNRYTKTLNMAKVAMKKEIAKKPYNKQESFFNCDVVTCPTCKKRLKVKSKGRYCDKCGQMLDWSEPMKADTYKNKYGCGLTDDITFCADDCNEKRCFRNSMWIIDKKYPHSYARFKGTTECFKVYKDSNKHL